MKVFYQFADGTTSIVEVDNELGNQIKDMERYEDKIQKREQGDMSKRMHKILARIRKFERTRKVF